MKNKTMRIIALICLGVFVYIFFKEGPVLIWNLLKEIAWYNWMILFFLRFVYLNLRTVNWGLICKQYDIKSSYGDLLKARVAGYAVGFISPQPKIGAEAVRALVLDKVSRRKVFASVVVDKTTELLSTIGLIVIGVIIAVLVFNMPLGLKMTFMGLAAFLVLFITYLYRKQKKGFFIWLLDLMKKLKVHPKRFENERDKIKDADIYISEFYGIHKKTFVQVFLLYMVQFFLWAFEYHITLLTVGIQGVSYPESLLILALSNLSFTLPAVPGSFGIYEITFVTIFKILSIPISMGITFILIRRVLGLTISGIGILPLLKGKTRRKLREKKLSLPFQEK
ncbi:MAG: flippase-like domain-containing protein [Candidatus Aminicenantes bacterium]|nr:flippase-like domain-containing protein [Candidatus Aminicenantes bacterium]